MRPFETRKLWLLNGSHSLMAYAGSLRGHETVADAIADPVVRSWVEEWWDAAAPAPRPARGRRVRLSPGPARPLRNPHIRHLLAQIAADGSQKVPIRAVPVIRAELDEGRVAAGATRIVAAWVAHLRGHGAPVTDAAADDVVPLAQGEPGVAVRAVLAHLGIQSETVARDRGEPSSRTSSPGPGHDRGAGRHRARHRDDRGQGRRLRPRPGRQRSAAVREVPAHPAQVRLAHPEPGRRPRGHLDALTECVTALDGAPVLAISVSTAMHALIGLDAELAPLTPLITWADARARDEARELRDPPLAAELHRRSGTPVHSMSPLTKLRWFARTSPS